MLTNDLTGEMVPICANCGGDEFYYLEHRVMQVEIVNLSMYEELDGSIRVSAELGGDFPDQQGGEVPDELYYQGTIRCKCCGQMLGLVPNGPSVELKEEEYKYVD